MFKNQSAIRAVPRSLSWFRTYVCDVSVEVRHSWGRGSAPSGMTVRLVWQAFVVSCWFGGQGPDALTLHSMTCIVSVSWDGEDGYVAKARPKPNYAEESHEKCRKNATACFGMLESPGGIGAGIRSGTHVEGTSWHVSSTGNHHKEKMVEKLPTPSWQGLPTTRDNRSLRGKNQGLAETIAPWTPTNNWGPRQNSTCRDTIVIPMCCYHMLHTSDIWGLAIVIAVT